MAVTSSSKWSCPTCTYNNWQSLPKCVLCGSSKPIDVVIPRTPVAKYRQQNSGWSKLGSGGVGPSQCLELNIPSTVDSPPYGNVAQKSSAKCKTKGKWVCNSCTSLNWPNAGQCTSCGASRTRPTQTSRPPNRSSESILLYPSGAVGGASVSGSCDMPLHSAKAKNGRHGNRGGQALATNTENRKWKCQRCTYENWPRAAKCTMCLGSKIRTPSPPLSGGEDSTLSTPPPPSPHPLHVSPSPHPHSPTLPNSNSSLSTNSPSIATRGHSNSNDICEARTDVGGGVNANKLNTTTPSKDASADPSTNSRGRRKSHGSDRYNSIPRQVQLKSDTDEVL